jgi:hypothetical protein
MGLSDPDGEPTMSSSDDDFEAGNDFDEELEGGDLVEASVWELLSLINPGDEETALQQFSAYREAIAQADDEDIDPVQVVGRVIDWRSGFRVDGKDTRALVQAIDELASRWNLDIDWDGDPDDDDFHADIDAASLFATAYDRLAEHGYTLWSWETDDDTYAGWMTSTRDNEIMRELATSLSVNIRPGSDVT